MINCKKCNKAISNPEDLKVLMGYPHFFLGYGCYCNSCYGTLIQETKGIRVGLYRDRRSVVLNSLAYRVIGIVFGGVWFIMASLAIFMTFEGELPFVVEGGLYGVYSGLVLITLLLAGWGIYYQISQRKVREVKHGY